MPRQPRLVVPGVPMHVIQRGNNRSRMFADNDDCRWFRAVLNRLSRDCGCAIHAYVFMPNHVHMLLTPAKIQAPAHMMQRLGRAYVRYFNDKHGRSGTLWEGRFRSNLVESDRYFFTCSRYIELNPARAGMVGEPADYRWSSHRANAHGVADPMIVPHELYTGLHASRSQRVAAYRGMFTNRLDGRLLDAIRTANRRGAPLGDSEFCGAMTARRRPQGRGPHGGDRRSLAFQRQSGGDEENVRHVLRA